MPRNPAAKKNQHNNRHENGLVGPGKRVTKQKSNGHINGNHRPVFPHEPISTDPNLDSQQHTCDPASQAVSSGVDTPPHLKQRCSESSTDGQDSRWEAANGNASPSPRRPQMSSFKSRGVQDFNAVQIASTILRSCPAGDTVALLIVLLALPSMVLTIVQALFASLTLMPPTNVSPVAFLSLFDVFQGSTGSPSLGTMAVVDLICLGLWICLWNWAQNFALDLAQIQIAITLGNGNSGKNGSVNTFCFAIVLLLHCFRSAGVHKFFVSNLIPANIFSHPRIADIMQYLPSEADLGESPGSPSKLRSLFAIHILSQAFMAFVRRRVAGTQGSPGSKASKRVDPEAYAGNATSSEVLTVDSVNTISASGIDHQSPPTPSYKDTKERLLSAKKRRRQANQVRSRQPFWAALASTKVHVFREIEHGQGNRATSSENQSSVISQANDNLCVIDVEPSSIQLEASYTEQPFRDAESATSGESKPFNVRINGAKWHSVQFEPLDDERWIVTISGLAPDCTYTCSFSRVGDEVEIASVMVRTPALQDNDTSSSFAPAPARGSLRPSSPTTTLRNSIQTADVRLNEARARLTKSKRAHKAASSRVEREVDSLNARLKSSSDDTKQRQKLLQAERSIRQTEDATANIETELEGLQAIPEAELVDYEEKKAAHDERSKTLNTAQEAYDVATADVKNQLGEVNNELTSMTSRRDRLKTRQEKLVEQHNRITEANARGLNEKERKAAETVARNSEQHNREQELLNAINGISRDLRDIHNRIANDHREIESLERQTYAQREIMLNAGPLTPEGNLPGTNPPQPRTFAFGQTTSNLATSTLASDLQSSPFLAYANTLPNQRTRSNTNRSNGANSNYSANDFEDADPIPPAFDGGANDRKSSGSSRGQNNGSPAGIIGESVRSPPRATNSPGVIHQVKW